MTCKSKLLTFSHRSPTLKPSWHEKKRSYRMLWLGTVNISVPHRPRNYYHKDKNLNWCDLFLLLFRCAG